MSDPVVCSFITKVLCSRGGCLEEGQLAREVGLPEQQLKQILEDVGPERYLRRTRGGAAWVWAVSAVRICFRKECAGCPNLHLCKLSLMGRCRVRACKYSHDVLSEHNRKVLKNHELSGLNENELRVLLLQNDPFVLPDVCNAYNKGEGNCNQHDNCTRLHVCRYFLRGQCRFPRCKRSHCLMEPKALRLLLEEGVDDKVASNIQTICAYKTAALAGELGTHKSSSSTPKPAANQEKSNAGNQSKSIFDPSFSLNAFTDMDVGQGSSSTPKLAANQEKSNAGNQSKSIFDPSLSWNAFMDVGQGSSSTPKPATNQEKSNAGNQSKSIFDPSFSVNAFIDMDVGQGSSSTPKPATNQEKSNAGNQSKSIFDPSFSVNAFIDMHVGQGSSSTPKPAANQEKSNAGNQSKSIFDPSFSVNAFIDMDVGQGSSSTPKLAANQEKSNAGNQSKSIFDPSLSRNAFMDVGQATKTALCPRSSQNAEKEKIDEICLYYIFRFCKNKNNCSMIHYHLPYRWQIQSGSVWKDLSNGEEIEKAYCDPSITSLLDSGINFRTMTSSTARIRRLSTPSSVTKPAKFVMTTKWIWYWKNDMSQWIEYGKQDGKTKCSDLSSDDLENLFLADPDGSIHFQAGSQHYEISFKEMIQRNVLYLTKREIRRRPKFVSSEDVKMKKGHTAAAAPVTATPWSPTSNYPNSWDKSALPSVGYKAVELSKVSPEYIAIENLFQKTMSNYVIQRIRRIQNPSLWEIFQWQKEQMKKKKGGQNIDERLLFHGTNSSTLEAICNDNFDWRICGTNGTVFGKGSYFARDAQYSHNYCQRDAKVKVMFVARVLVGDFTVGHATYSRPPAKANAMLQYYDSCVDKMIDPSIFVIFEKHQIYPEYMIYYSEEEKKCILS